jgi:hypothetical protein
MERAEGKKKKGKINKGLTLDPGGLQSWYLKAQLGTESGQQQCL